MAVMADAGGYRDRPVAPIGRRAAGRGLQDPATLMPMTGDGPQMTPREPGREPNRQDLLVRGRARPGRQPDVVPDHDALLAWLTPARRLGSEVNRFQGLVSDNGDTRLERYGGD